MSRSWEPPKVKCLMKVTGHEFGKSETGRVIYRARISWNFNDARKKKKSQLIFDVIRRTNFSSSNYVL